MSGYEFVLVGLAAVTSGAVKALTDFQKSALPNQQTKGATDLIIAAEIAEIRTQKYITAFAVNAFDHARFQVFCPRIIPSVFPKYDL
jgi:hypothetical protein